MSSSSSSAKPTMTIVRGQSSSAITPLAPAPYRLRSVLKPQTEDDDDDDWVEEYLITSARPVLYTAPCELGISERLCCISRKIELNESKGLKEPKGILSKIIQKEKTSSSPHSKGKKKTSHSSRKVHISKTSRNSRQTSTNDSKQELPSTLVSEWRMNDVSLFLVYLDLSHCIDMFEDFKVDGPTLLEMMKSPPLWLSSSDFKKIRRSVRTLTSQNEAPDLSKQHSVERVAEWMVENENYLL